MAAVVFAAPGDVPNAATIRAASTFVRTLPSAPGAAALATVAPPKPQNKTPDALRKAAVSDDRGRSPPLRRRAARLTRWPHSPASLARLPRPRPASSPLHPNDIQERAANLALGLDKRGKPLSDYAKLVASNKALAKAGKKKFLAQKNAARRALALLAGPRSLSATADAARHKAVSVY